MANRKATTRFAIFAMLATVFLGKGLDEKTSNKRAYHQAMLGGGNPEYLPSKHPKMTYGQQNRLAKQRKKSRAKAPK
jgi:hypothetical protein